MKFDDEILEESEEPVVYIENPIPEIIRVIKKKLPLDRLKELQLKIEGIIK